MQMISFQSFRARVGVQNAGRHENIISTKGLRFHIICDEIVDTFLDKFDSITKILLVPIVNG